MQAQLPTDSGIQSHPVIQVLGGAAVGAVVGLAIGSVVTAVGAAGIGAIRYVTGTADILAFQIPGWYTTTLSVMGPLGGLFGGIRMYLKINRREAESP